MSRPPPPPAEPEPAQGNCPPDARLRLLLETIPVALLNCDRDGLIEYFNSHAVHLWGRTPTLRDPRERYCGSFRIFGLGGEPLAHADSPMARALHTGRPQVNEEWQLERPDGTRVVVLVNVAPHLDSAGRVTGAVSCMLDITDRKRMEKLLQAREQEFRSISENSADPIARVNREYVRTYVNPALARTHGLPREVLIGKKLASAPLGLQQSVQSVFSTGQPADVEFRWPQPTGVHYYAVHLEPEFGPNGELESVLCIGRDMTERQRAEEETRESQRLLQQVLATLPVGVMVTTPTGDAILVNEVSRRIWGGDTIVEGRERWARSKGFWHDTGKQVDPDDWASVRALKLGQTSVNELIDIETFDGQQKTILNSAAPIHNAEGQITGAVIVNEDVTEQKQREEKLRQTEAELARVARLMMMGELTATIAHEVNQPLAAVVTNANAGLRWLAAEPPNLAEAREAVARIAREGARASAVIQRMRALIKRSEPTRAPLDLNDLAREALLLTRVELVRHKVSLETDFAPELPPVMADRVQLQQVLLNLVVNALDSLGAVSGRTRILRIATKYAAPDEVQVTVQDNGAGIAAPDNERLFDAFYTTKPDGLGMGLAISRSIVEAHGGHLSATRNDGPGATFQFSLPVPDDEP